MRMQIRSVRRQAWLAAGALTVLVPVVSASPPPSPIAGQLQAFAPAGTPVEEVARVIENICPALSPAVGDLKTQCDDIVGNALGGTDVAGALAGLSGMASEEASAIDGTMIDAQAGRQDSIEARLSAMRGGRASATGSTLTLNGRTVDARAVLGDGIAAGDGLGGWGFFVNGSFSRADKDGTLRESGFELDDFRVTVGVDYQVAGRWVAGGAVHYVSADADLDQRAGDLSVDALGASLYASFFPTSAMYVDAIVSYYRNDFDQNRNIRYAIAGSPPVDQTARSSFHSDDLSASLTVGYDLTSGGWRYGPYGRLTIARVETDGYRETMSVPGAPGSGLALQMDSARTTSVPVSIGLQASRSFTTAWGTVFPHAFVEYVHEFDNDAKPTSGFFLDDPFQERFALPVDAPDRDYVAFGLGVAAQLGSNGTAHLIYQGLAGYRDLTVHSVGVGLRWEW